MKRLPVIAERSIAEIRALQIEADQRYQRSMITRDVRTTCTKGCSHCCYHPFLITVAEGLLLYRWLLNHGRWSSALKKHIEETRDKVLGLSYDVWLLSNIPCPLLQGNECSAYEARPLRCRLLFSVGDPEMCRPNELGVATPLLSYADFIIGFSQRSQTALKKAGVKDGHLMPLAEALLLADAIDNGRLDLTESDYQHLRDLFHG